MVESDTGLLVAGMGLPGIGKSSVFRELGSLIGARAFLEPEEKDWPAAVARRTDFGYFTGLSWFRAARVPLLYEADALRRRGWVTLVDSYYDKLLAYYLHTPGMAGVIPPQDPYFELTREMAQLDLEHLPDADVIVFFEIEEDAWRSFLTQRGRDQDQYERALGGFETQEYMRQAVNEYCEVKSCQLLTFSQKRSSPRDAAQELLESLRAEGVALENRAESRVPITE
jgi:hypothetical protein